MRRSRTAPARRLEAVVVDGHGRALRRATLSKWLVQAAPASARGRVTIALVSDAQMHALNRRFRRVDRSTDVLSFPASPEPSASRLSLGDIVIARGVAKRQARALKHSELTELRVLALHGLLHLLGYDHESDNGRMERVEQRLRRRAGLAAGLLERSAGGS